MSMFKEYLAKLFASSTEVTVPNDDKNRFNVLFQKMMNTRWYITAIVLLTLLTILLAVSVSILFKATMAQEWKEILLLILGAFIGSYNRVIDFWFNSSQRDQILLQKMDEENDSEELVKDKLKTSQIQVAPATEAIMMDNPDAASEKKKK